MVNFQKKYTDHIFQDTVLRYIPRELTPNMMTLARFMSLPLLGHLILTGQYTLAFFVFVFAALTDALDGAMARTRNQITELGALIDGIADKALIGLTAFLLLPQFVAHGWLILFVLVVLEVFHGIWVWRLDRKVHGQLHANWAGKTKMIVQSLAFVVLFLSVIFAMPKALGAASLLIYLSILFLILEPFQYDTDFAEDVV